MPPLRVPWAMLFCQSKDPEFVKGNSYLGTMNFIFTYLGPFLLDTGIDFKYKYYSIDITTYSLIYIKQSK